MELSFSRHWQGRIDVKILRAPQLGVQNPQPRKISRISLDPRDFPRASPLGNLLGLGKFGDGDGFPNTSLVLVEHGYNPGNPLGKQLW